MEKTIKEVNKQIKQLKSDNRILKTAIGVGSLEIGASSIAGPVAPYFVGMGALTLGTGIYGYLRNKNKIAKLRKGKK